MAEFLTMQEAEDKFGKKGRTNAALTLGIIGTALGAFTGNNGCGCGNNGILGGLFGGNNGNCIAEKAMQTAMAQGQMSQNLAGTIEYSLCKMILTYTLTSMVGI